MPSTSKKQQKAASSRLQSSSNSDQFSASVSSAAYSSPRHSQNPDDDIDEDELLCSLEVVSKRFPCFISKSAFIGKVHSDSATTTAASVMEGLDSKGCKIWLSESAMLAASVAPGSIVSVSLANLTKVSNHYPLCSFADEFAMNFGMVIAERLADEAGCYFALAAAFPSSKLVKNAVRLSSNLLLTMGCPASGRTVYVNPVQHHPLMGFSECKKTHSLNEFYLSLCKGKDIGLSLVYSNSKLTPSSVSSNRLLAETTQIQDGTCEISSPKTPVFPQSKLRSFNSGQLTRQDFEESGSILSKPQESLDDILDVDNLGDDKVRKLFETCCVGWLFSRILLLGNFVAIPILSRICIFLVVSASNLSLENNIHNLAEKTNCNMIPEKVEKQNCTRDAYLVQHGTKVNVALPRISSSEMLKGALLSADMPKLGGLSQEFAVLKEIVISSAVRCDLARMGLRPTKGVLLHGPPGTGKTSLVRLCVLDAGVNLFPINGPEIISQYYGESERAMHEVFDAASKALPAVIFIDELDAIAPARKDGSEELSQRMVATLLNLMDGISRTDGLVVIAATNRPDSIEPALRRPGRLDREMEIGVPSPKKRLEILQVLLSDMENSLLDMEVQSLATATHGFVGADLAALCNEAAMVCLRRFAHAEIASGSANFGSSSVLQNCSFSGETNSCCNRSENNLKELSLSLSSLHISSESTDAAELGGTFVQEDPILRVTFEDFEKARLKVRPSAMREIILEIPKVRWEDVGGQKEVKTQLMEAVEWPQKHRDAFTRIGTRPPSGVLMFGPPGCSKTLLARAVASEAGLNFLAVKGPELFSKWVGESEKAVRSLFAKARANAPSIIFFDEIDGLAVIRGKESDGVSVADRVMSQLLVEMDGLHERLNVTVIAATNRPDKIDPALLRPGRFDRLLYVGPPDIKDREEIFRVHLRKMPCSSDVSIGELAILADGYTGADISRICREAAIIAMEDDINASEISMKHLRAGISKVQPSEIQSYKELSSKFQRLVHTKVEGI
ncbi:OLC1v1036328C4 [Oldenlandia corymbosa var. corymbosa]|uniref:OLC1v1036328C4 n=1 Tax=Oldenlandia corymbosa var. corymbosa TaxID=529605 RepID=A0AAV1CWZ8_OLDCO|nr:OLC1v1036328C4 [Oldenlandia corymbosa var. corymbosa]